MSFVDNANAPEYEAARTAAERIARVLKDEFPEYQIEIVEDIRHCFVVCLQVPFRKVHLTWDEKEALGAEAR